LLAQNGSPPSSGGVILLIVGFIAGGVGGALVFIGALLGLISRLIKKG